MSSLPGFRVTSRDREIVRWVGRLRMAAAAQVGERFHLGRAVSYARLSGLVKLGLLEHARIFHATPGVYVATRSGLAAVDLGLPPARVDVRTYDHDLELSALVIALEREVGANRVFTEREMRAADTPVGTVQVKHPRFAVPLAGSFDQRVLTSEGHPRLHFSDCAVTAPSGEQIVAIELERTPKGRARLRRILSGYVAARHIAGVQYYTLDDRVRQLLRTEIQTVRGEDLIEVRTWSATSRSPVALTGPLSRSR